MADVEVQQRLGSLLSRMSLKSGNLGFMSAAVYDTAWVAMVAKDTGNGKQWLFPQCFEWVLSQQLEDGGWASYSADVDGILNTGAALFAILEHIQNPYELASEYPIDKLQERVERGRAALDQLLQQWNVATADHVGFEILVPMILEQLEQRGVSFDFPGKGLLLSMRDAKFAKFKPQYLYMPISTTALHSLEAFAGKIDYDKVRHHKLFGAYMASPSSTAAVLIYGAQWDQESEDYLRWTFTEGAGQGSGGMPSAYPSTYFELTWVLTTLLEAGFTKEDFGDERVAMFTTFLRKELDAQKGRIGFAPSVGVDVDDTSKTLLTLSQLGAPAPHDGLLAEFEAETHFRTYAGERNPSFTANCNALVAILSQPEVSDLAPQVHKIASFLSRTWDDVQQDGIIADKWNLSTHYPCMLMAEAFSSLISKWSVGCLPGISIDFIQDRIATALFQVLVRTLSSQNPNGSWSAPPSTFGPGVEAATREVTAYATITICKAASLPLIDRMRPKIEQSVAAAKAFLSQPLTSKAVGYLWVEKVTYGSHILCESYVLAALKSTPAANSLSEPAAPAVIASLSSVPNVDPRSLLQNAPDAESLLSFSDTWLLDAAYIESCLYRPALQRLAHSVVPDSEGHRAFEAVPFIWTVCNYADKFIMSAAKLRQNMNASLLRTLIEAQGRERATAAGSAGLQTVGRAQMNCVAALNG